MPALWRKKLGTQHTIARSANPEYEKQLRFMRDELGLSMIINPEKTTAREDRAGAALPSAIKREQFCRQRFGLIECHNGGQPPGRPAAGRDLYRNIRVKILIPCGRTRQETIIPTGTLALQAGDKIYLTASAGTWNQLLPPAEPL